MLRWLIRLLTLQRLREHALWKESRVIRACYRNWYWGRLEPSTKDDDQIPYAMRLYHRMSLRSRKKPWKSYCNHSYCMSKQGFFCPNDGSGTNQRCTQYTCHKCGKKEVRGYLTCDDEDLKKESVLDIDMDAQ